MRLVFNFYLFHIALGWYDIFTELIHHFGLVTKLWILIFSTIFKSYKKYQQFGEKQK